MIEALERLPKNEQSLYSRVAREEDRIKIKVAAARLVDYLQSEEITSLLLLDRAARPAYKAIRASWQRRFPGQRPLFTVYFLNPRGFLTADDLRIEQPFSGCSRLREELDKGLRSGDIRSVMVKERTEQEIEADFNKVFSGTLIRKKDQPALLFDNCIHDGGSLKPVKRTLISVGFADLRTGVGSTASNYSGIKPDLVLFPDTVKQSCNLFGEDRMVRKPFESVVSERNIFTFPREDSALLRQELGKVG